MTPDLWHLERDTWYVTRDMWHMTHDMWHVTHGGGWTFSQNVSSLALMDWDLWCVEDWEEKDQLIIPMNDEGVYRTATTSLGLLITRWVSSGRTESLQTRSLIVSICHMSSVAITNGHRATGDIQIFKEDMLSYVFLNLI